ncbi:MAG: MBL fold metallo-hydrolase [Alphaproteobacteria bacterium]
MVDVTFVGSGDAFGTGGRFQTCILLDGSERRVAVDFGASSLVALNKMEIPHNSIDVIVLTHLHGDHYGGVPFLLLDAMLGAKRTTPLVIAGPRGAEKRLAAIGAALFPGMEAMKPKFDLSFVEMDLMTSDLLISECYAYDKSPPFHLNYPDILEHWDDFGAKRIVLTHMGPAMLAHSDTVPQECAYDGLVISL